MAMTENFTFLSAAESSVSLPALWVAMYTDDGYFAAPALRRAVEEAAASGPVVLSR